MSDKALAKWYNDKMDQTTRETFGKNYLDTKNHECKHIRDMFKDWDDATYGQQVLEHGSRMDVLKYTEMYKKHLTNRVNTSPYFKNR
mgnify:CR=1 FL=1